jgi:hypothetical protein
MGSSHNHHAGSYEASSSSMYMQSSVFQDSAIAAQGSTAFANHSHHSLFYGNHSPIEHSHSMEDPHQKHVFTTRAYTSASNSGRS